MLAKARSVALMGMKAVPVEVEVFLEGGLPEFHIVGLPSQAVKEARKRVKSAVTVTEKQWPTKKITANLAPGDLRKEGPMFDLALAVCLVAAFTQRPFPKLPAYLLVGELALDGRLRPVRGALAAALAARDAGAKGILVPSQNAAEAAFVQGVEAIAVETLFHALAFLSGELTLEPEPAPSPSAPSGRPGEGDLADVRGQGLARRALEIAAAGRHNVLLVGPPGCGKTMLARRLPGILPPLSIEEALEVTHVWSVAGLLDEHQSIVSERPFRSPHHHASSAAVIGGGHPLPRPGEVSNAHLGVLFLDELPLFNRGVLEALRQPLEEGFVTVARQGYCVRFPSNFCMVAAANPCLCGRLGNPLRPCGCAPGRLDAYRSRLSGPLLDRIDLHVEVPLLTPEELLEMPPSEPSRVVRARVVEARRFQAARLGARSDDSAKPPVGSPEDAECRERKYRSDPPRRPVSDAPELASLSPSLRRFLSIALSGDHSSARAVNRALRVARTIADLEGAACVSETHVGEALQFRRSAWDHR